MLQQVVTLAWYDSESSTVEGPCDWTHTRCLNQHSLLSNSALTHGQPVNSLLHGVLPLHAACSSGSEQIVRMLIDRGADVNAPRLPRRYAETLHQYQQQLQLQHQQQNQMDGLDGSSSIGAGPSSGSSLSRRAKNLSLRLSSSSRSSRKEPLAIVGQAGSTPLHFAAANGHVPVVRILLACGAVHDKADKHGHTPEMLAEANGHEEVVETLRAWAGLVEWERERLRAKELMGEHEDGESEDVTGAVLLPGGKPTTATAPPPSKRDRTAADGTTHKASFMQGLEHLFQGRRRSSAIAPDEQTEDASQSGEGSVASSSVGGKTVYAPPSKLLPPDGSFTVVSRRISGGEHTSRRPSLPSIFEKGGHGLGFRKSSLRRVSKPGPEASSAVSTSSTPVGSFSSEIPPDVLDFRGRLRSRGSEYSQYSEGQESNPSIHSAARHMSRASLLSLFRKGAGGSHDPLTGNRTPPSPSPSPPRGTPTPLLPENIDDSVERIKRVSLDGIARSRRESLSSVNRTGSNFSSSRRESLSSVNRPGSIVSNTAAAGTGGGGGGLPDDDSKRKRSGSQVTFSDVTSPSPPLSAPPTVTTFDMAGEHEEEEDDDDRRSQDDRHDSSTRPSQSRSRPSSISEGRSGAGLRPLSRIGNEATVPSPLGQEWKEDGARQTKKPAPKSPKSILRKQKSSPQKLNESMGPTNASLTSSAGAPVFPSSMKKRSATMPENMTIDLFRRYRGDADVEEEGVAQSSHTTTDLERSGSQRGYDSAADKHNSERQDQVGESIWDRAAARENKKKAKKRTESLGSISMSAIVPLAPALSSSDIATFTPNSGGGGEVSQGHRRTGSADGPVGGSSIISKMRHPVSHRRPRNRSVSSVSTAASGATPSTSTYDSGLTPFTPMSQNTQYEHSASSIGVGDVESAANNHAKKGVARRVSKQKEKNPPLLYDVPVVGSNKERTESILQDEKLELSRTTSDAEEAAAKVKKSEQEILMALSGPPGYGSSASLAEQLAAYGDSLLLQKQLASGASPSSSSQGLDTDKSSILSTGLETVSRSYVNPVRPQLRETDSSDSTSTIKTESSIRRTTAVPPPPRRAVSAQISSTVPDTSSPLRSAERTDQMERSGSLSKVRRRMASSHYPSCKRFTSLCLFVRVGISG